MQIRSEILHKVANRQTHKQTNNDDYISALAEVINELMMIMSQWSRGVNQSVAY